jgi:hypothetical protein
MSAIRENILHIETQAMVVYDQLSIKSEIRCVPAVLHAKVCKVTFSSSVGSVRCPRHGLLRRGIQSTANPVLLILATISGRQLHTRRSCLKTPVLATRQAEGVSMGSSLTTSKPGNPQPVVQFDVSQALGSNHDYFPVTNSYPILATNFSLLRSAAKFP